MIGLDVEIEAGDRSKDLEPLLRRAAEAALAAAPEALAGPVSATLLLTDDASVRELNRAWRGQDKPTNVLSFPASAPAIPGEPRHLGDIALAFETLVREAEADGTHLADHASHLVVHGILHLLGEDHGTEDDAEVMEAAEVKALATLGIADPYREPTA